MTTTHSRMIEVEAPRTWPRTIALHLLPAAALLTVFLAVGPLLAQRGLPPIWALLGGVLLVLVPLELGILALDRARRKAAGQPVTPLLGLGTLRPKLVVPVGVAVFAASLLLPGTVLSAESKLRGDLLGWLPNWFSAGPGDLATQPPAHRIVTLTLWLVALVIVGPVVEEAYFRGYLQPRIPTSATASSLVGTALFTVYHLWQPSAWLTIAAFTLPLAVLAARTGATAVTAAVHVAVNVLTFLGLILGVMVR